MAPAILEQKLASARVIDFSIALLVGSVRVVTRMAGVFLIIFLVDYQVYRMPVLARVLAWGVILATLVYFVMKFIRGAFVAGRSDDALALRVESAYPTLAGRLIAAVQLARRMDEWYRRGVALIVEALRKQTEAMARALRFTTITPFKPLVRTTGLFCLVGGLCAFTIVDQGQAWGAFWERMGFGRGVYPSKYKIAEVSPGDKYNPAFVIRGASQTFHVRFAGPVPDTASLAVTDSKGRVSTFPMNKSGGASFSYTLPRVVEAFKYGVRGGDASADRDQYGNRYEILVRIRPVTMTTLLLNYPTYTGLPSRKVRGGTAKVIEGTRIQVNANTSKGISEIKLIYLSGPRAGTELPMNITSSRSAMLDLPEPLRQGFRYTIWVKDTEGVTNFESVDSAENPPPVYSLRTMPDQRPKIAVIDPTTESFELLEGANILVKAVARDDYGIVSVALHWKLVRSEREQVGVGEDGLVALERTIPKEEKWEVESLYRVGVVAAPSELERTYSIASTNMGATAGDRIVFFVEARDHTAPTLQIPGLPEEKLPRGTGRSKEYNILIIDEKRGLELERRRLEEVAKAVDDIARDWNKDVHRKIEPPVTPETNGQLLEKRWNEAQEAEKAKEYGKALELYRRIQRVAPESELAEKARNRIAAIEAEMKKKKE